jgi:hypothetical protein
MAGPAWLAAVLAAVAIATACYCACRLATATGLGGPSWWPRAVRLPARPRAAEVDGDAVHLVMGVAMAGMLVPRLSLLPGAAWTVVFGAAAAWFAGQGIRGLRGATSARRQTRPGRLSAHPVPHLVECVAMIYMLAAVRGAAAGRNGAMPGMAGRATPGGSLIALAVLLAIFMVGYVLWTADQLTSLARPVPAAARSAAGGQSASPVLAACVKMAMGVTMGYMLLAML